jgi:choline-sulfatase
MIDRMRPASAACSTLLLAAGLLWAVGCTSPDSEDPTGTTGPVETELRPVDLYAAAGRPLPAGARLDEERELIFLPYGETLDFYAHLPHGGELTVERLSSRGGAPDEVTVTAERDGGSSTQLEPLSYAEGASRTVAVPGGEGDDLTRLRLTARGSGDGGAVLIRPSARARVAARPGAGDVPAARAEGDKPPRPPNVVIYLVDTLRADHLGVYGYDKPTSPRIDAFARDAVVFEDAQAQASWTRPAVASIFTGLEPDRHDVQTRDDSISPESVTLAELLSASGYRTVGVVTNGNAGETFGFAQGFDRFVRAVQDDREADRVNVLAFRELEEIEEPFFLWVHTIDPHAPYEPREEWRERFYFDSGSEKDLGDMEQLKAFRRGDPATAEERREVISLYDAEIAFNDEYFGQLLDRLEELGFYDDAMIAFVSDHGEEFWEHDNWGHGHTLYEENLNVPLLVKLPGRTGGGRVAETVQQTDLFATALDVAGVELPSYVNAISLRRWIEDDAFRAPPRDITSFLDLDGQEGASVIADGFKLIVPKKPTRLIGLGPMLFDREADRDETRNLAEERELRMSYLRSLLARHREVSETFDYTAGTALMDPELVQELKALGYLQ